MAESADFGGAFTFQGLTLQVTFASTGQVIRVETGEEQPAVVSTPGGERLYLVARAVEGQKDLLRVRVMRTAERRGPRVTGEVLEELEFPFSGTGTTIRQAETFTVALTRIGRRQIR